ncbi:P-loop containing nucleoside triphosphate hydrolase protein [Pseudomassariella vexata]|uniref:Peroxisomal ATPase PEX6 n=1 Tax=Pseudomassariella vexata TaxID=1141098 RepID=A0A1Y2E3Z7_9PEZI|nr:P-loop containing nucleoside triphosphate hydrolase protein [Pseudomassariella vexata]ORY66283.1 P-loop containing nucleoside triphosphate hydrolase protein [Pseudomassariella vexata]
MTTTNTKRRRRRRQDKPSITARLVLDDHVRGDTGILSDDLFADLFPHLSNERSADEESKQSPELYHVAIAPWAPNSAPTRTSWTVVPISKSSALAHSTIQFSPSSLALQSFATTLQQIAPSKLSNHSRSGIEVYILDVAALELDTVFVSLEGDLAKRLENGEGTFFRDHPSAKGKGVAAPDSSASRLADALRVALGSLKVVHDGDLFPLPLPPHQITHVPPTPGKVLLCEPVAQGILGPSTKIVLSRGNSASKHDRKAVPSSQALNGATQDDADDTGNDQFFSAAEERNKTDAATETETDLSEPENEDDLSDDSLDDIISLQAPTLPTTAASGVSTMQPGTPRTIGRGRKTNGMTTPGSVFSAFTAATARPDRPKGRLFKAHGLMNSIPADLLHPKPTAEDDEEARIYVDIASLAGIGCFSGDWVRVEASEEPPSNGSGLFGLGSFGHSDAMEPVWRPAKVFGLPEGYSHRPVTRIPSGRHDMGNPRPSFFESQMQKFSTPGTYLSPLLLTNMDNPPYLRLSPLKRHAYPPKLGQAKITGSSHPPTARDVIVQQIRTPTSSERTLQTAILSGLKNYFSKCTRVVKMGDIIGIPIDTQLGKALQESSAAGDGSAVDDILGLTASKKADTPASKPDDSVWFKIGHVQRQKSDSVDDDDEEDIWGGVACVDHSVTQIAQSGAVVSLLPGTKDSNWPFYLGLEETSSKTFCPYNPEQIRRFVSPLQRRLRELMAAATSKRAIHLKMPPVAVLIVSTQRGIGKATVATKACSDIGLHTFTINAYDIVNESGAGGSDSKTEISLKARTERALNCGAECCALLIRHIEALTADRMVTAMREILDDARILIATTTEVDKVPDGIRGLFTHELEMSAPDEGEREAILRSIIEGQGVGLAPEVDLSGVAIKTAALVAGDLVDVVERALVARQSRLEALSAKASTTDSRITLRDIQVAGGSAARCLTKADFDIAVDAARKNFADAIGAPKIPNVTWDDVGGLNNVKEAVMETIQLPLERPELFAKGMKKRSGILFYGPPGTGKTLLAKAIATEYSLNFFSVKGPELLNMYIGESEANVRRVFQRARDARPCVVFFDELDSVAPKRGNQGDSGGVMDRIVSQLLAELDGMSGGDDGGGGVFVIGATNRPDLLDQALLRPGRFDKMLYLGVSDTHDKQITIMEALTRKFTLHPSVSLPKVAEHLPFTYTGADFYALCSDAMLKAVTRQATAVDAKIRAINADPETHHPISTANFFDHHATPEDIAVMVTEQDFLDANHELIPSVSAGESRHYEQVRATFEGGRGEKKNGGPQQQDIAAMMSDSNSVRSKGKGKQKAVVGKGKGKAVAGASNEEDEDDDAEKGAYSSHGTNGKSSKGKGKAVAMFQEGTASDDEGLY